MEDLFDLTGIDLVAPPIDEIAGSSFDPHEFVLIDPGEIASGEIALMVEAVTQLGSTCVSDRHVGRPDHELADLPWGQERSVLSDDLEGHAGMRPPGGAQLLWVCLGVSCCPTDHLSQLGLPIAVEDECTEPLGEASGLEG